MDRPFPAYQGDEPYIFVSYSHKDSGIVYGEIQWLKDQGFNIWYDEGISPGASWREELAESILGCGLFIILITPKSAGSENCLKELNFALEHGRSILAVHLEQTELSPGLELALNDRQAILRHELNYEQYQEKILAGVSTYIEPAQISQPSNKPIPPSTKNILSVKNGLIAFVIILALGIASYSFLDRQKETTLPRLSGPDVKEIDTKLPPAGKIRSNWIAVLPFSKLTESPETTILSRGLTTQLVDALAPISSFSLVPYRSVEKFLDRTLSLEEIARSLNVRYLVDGRIQHSGNKIRVSVALIDGVRGKSLWQETKTFQDADLLEIQDEMTLVTTRVLSTRMFSFENQRLSSISKQNMDADELSVLARYFWLDPNQENLEVAISDLRRALEINPAHANSTSTLAHLLGQYSWVGGEDPEAIRMEVCELASRALVLGRDDMQSVSSVGFALIDSCGEATVALQMTERAIKENPLNATMWATHGYSLIASGDIKSGFEALEKAEQLDRDYVWVRFLTDAFRATALMDRGDWQKGVNLAQKATSADPSLYWVQIPLANALGMLGDYEGARKQWQLVKSRFPLLSVERYLWYQRYTKRAVIADRQVEGLIRAEVEPQD